MEYTGPAMTISFNAQYVLDFLNAAGADVVAVEFKDDGIASNALWPRTAIAKSADHASRIPAWIQRRSTRRSRCACFHASKGSAAPFCSTRRALVSGS